MSDRTLNPAYVEGVKQMLADTPYFQLLGMVMADMVPGRAEFALPVLRKHLNPFDRVHGGVFASILDAAIYWAVYSTADEGMFMTTAELKINYLAPAAADKTLRAVGEAVKVGKILGVGEARLFEGDSDRLVGFATATCMLIKAPSRGPVAALPPKFVTPAR